MNSTAVHEPPPLPQHRPVLVWVIAIFYGFSVLSTIVTYSFVFSKAVPKTPAQTEFFASLTAMDHAVTAVVVLINLAGAVLLFRLKKAAPVLFALAFALGVTAVVYQILTKNWFAAVGIPGVVSAVVGWCINVAIILYTFRLRQKRVLS
jgi:hypothetical protein